MSDAVELLPCPFCGELPFGPRVFSEGVVIECRGCCVELTHPDTIECVVVHWNTRAASPVGVQSREDFTRCAECNAPHPWHDSKCSALPHTGQPQGVGVTFCYVTYRACTASCPTREECALGKVMARIDAAPVAEKRDGS